MDWTQALQPLLTLALQLEREGQYNLAKLVRAAVDSLGRRAAYQSPTPVGDQQLVNALSRASDSLTHLEVGWQLIEALRSGTAALAEGRIPSITDTPHPYVCRTCGQIAMGEVVEKCPVCGAWQDTFQWFAPIYWLDALDPPAALVKLRQTPLDVATLMEGLSEEAMTREAQDGGWAIRNIITHMRDAQGVLDYRLDLFAQEDHPVLESKAVWTWAKNEEERPPSTREIFAEYQATRAKILDRLDKLPLADWWRTGRHGEFGEVSIKQQVSYFASHERTHLPQIERLR